MVLDIILIAVYIYIYIQLVIVIKITCIVREIQPKPAGVTK